MKVIDLGEVVITDIDLRSFMVFEDSDKVVLLQYVYYLVDDHGSYYGGPHSHTVTAPASLVAMWGAAKNRVKLVEGL